MVMWSTRFVRLGRVATVGKMCDHLASERRLDNTLNDNMLDDNMLNEGL